MGSERERKELLIASVVAGIVSGSLARAQGPQSLPAGPPLSAARSALRRAPAPAGMAPVGAAPRTRIGSLPIGKRSTRITMDFRDVPIDQILDFFGVVSGLTVIKDPGLAGTATVVSLRPIGLDAALDILGALLGSRGYRMVRTPTMLRIVPKEDGGPLDSSTDAQGPDQTRVFQLRYASAESLASLVNELFNGTPRGDEASVPAQGGPADGTATAAARPIDAPATPGGDAEARPSTARASADPRSNSVIVTGRPEQLRQIAEMVDRIDRPVVRDRVTETFQIRYVDAGSVATVVSRLLFPGSTDPAGGSADGTPPDGTASRAADPAANSQVVPVQASNSLIVTASAESIDRVRKLIAEIDVPRAPRTTMFVRKLKNASAVDVAQIVNQVYGRRDDRGAEPAGQATDASIPDAGSESTQVGGPADAGAAAQPGPPPYRPGAYDAAPPLVGPDGTLRAASAFGLDGSSPAAGPASGTRRPPIQAARADSDAAFAGALGLSPDAASGPGALVQLAQFPFGGGGGGFGGFGGFGGGGGAGARTNTSTSVRSSRGVGGAITNVVDPSGSISAVPDVNTNSLIIDADPATMAALDQILASLDKVPQQVLIEAVIVEATLDATSKLGFNFQWSQPNLGRNVAGTGTLDTRPTGFTPTGLQYTIVGNNFSSIMQALATDSRFKVLSTPKIFTANNREAQINVSQQVPYVTATLVNANGTTTQSFSFLDVGIILDVTPQITGNGLVTIQVNQQANDFQGFTSFNAPLVARRSTDTTVVVQDGQTVVIGGLIRDTTTKTHSKVPLLGDLPIVGSLFRSRNNSSEKTELMVFLTPHVTNTIDQASDVTEKQRNEMTVAPRVELSRPVAPPVPPLVVPPSDVSPSPGSGGPAPSGGDAGTRIPHPSTPSRAPRANPG